MDLIIWISLIKMVLMINKFLLIVLHIYLYACVCLVILTYCRPVTQQFVLQSLKHKVILYVHFYYLKFPAFEKKCNKNIIVFSNIQYKQ